MSRASFCTRTRSPETSGRTSWASWTGSADGGPATAGPIQSGAANAISQVAQKYACIYFNTNSSSPTEAGNNCHRVKFVCDGNGENFSKAAARNAIQTFGKKWFLIYNDYVWGQNTNEDTKKVALNYGAEVVDEVYTKLEKQLTVLYEMVTDKMQQKYSLSEIGQHLN